MNTSKHTQGQWVIKKSKSTTRTEIWVEGDIQPTFEVIHNETNSVETNANAKLIAAAPELLDACMKAYFMMANSPLSAMELLEKAILKATK